jgi:hypothetical protein
MLSTFCGMWYARERVDGLTDQTTPSHRNNKLSGSENNFIIEMSKEHTGAIIISRACKYKSRLVGSGTSSINYCDALYNQSIWWDIFSCVRYFHTVRHHGWINIRISKSFPFMYLRGFPFCWVTIWQSPGENLVSRKKVEMRFCTPIELRQI